MLALQLNAENDLDPDAHLNQLISKYEKHSRPQIQRNVSNNIEKLVTPASPQSFNEFDAAGKSIKLKYLYLNILAKFVKIHTDDRLKKHTELILKKHKYFIMDSCLLLVKMVMLYIA